MTTNKAFTKKEYDGAIYYCSENISAPHAFTTRIGGFSTEPHLASMNMGYNCGDKKENVARNYEKLGAAIGFTLDSIVMTKQIHSAEVRYVDENDRGKTFECDGLITDRPGVTLSVRTADCTPVLMYDPVRGAVAAVHAGWRGTAARIAPIAAEKLTMLGCLPENIHVAIGPCIRSCCYEVGEDFFLAIEDALGWEKCRRYVRQYGEGKYRADIAGMNTALLCEYGIPEENICDSGLCTACHPDIFFSHRASHGKRGLLASLICLR